MLYHVSEQSDIQRFDPRPANNVADPVVWAVNESRLRNYLLPRDCPRVTFFAGSKTSAEDADRFLLGSPAVIAIESAWLDRVRQARLFCYEMPESTFTCVDETAGYFHSTTAATPIRVELIDDLFAALVARNVEVRLVRSLWPLHDTVVASTLSYSIIRMRNAAPGNP
jgi:hypothetical protein